MNWAIARPAMESPERKAISAEQPAKTEPSCANIDVLFEEYKDYVYSVALYLCRRPAVAEDITQVVFLKLLRNKNGFRGEAGIKTWLYRIVLNAYIDTRRSDPVWLSFEDKEILKTEIPSDETPDRKMMQREQKRQVRHALSLLNPKLRVPLVLRYIAGLSYEEIARVLETSKGTVASRISRAHTQLAKKLHFLMRMK